MPMHFSHCIIYQFLRSSLSITVLAGIYFFSVVPTATAQRTIGQLRLKSATITIKENVTDAGVQQELQKGKWNQLSYGVIVFEQKPTAAQLNYLQLNGIELLHYLPDYAFQVRLKNTAAASVLRSAGVKSFLHLPGEMKYSKGVAMQLQQPTLPNTALIICVQLMPGVKSSDVLPWLQQDGFTLTRDQFLNGGLLIGTAFKSNISKIASYPFVQFIGTGNYTLSELVFREPGVLGLTGLTSSQGASRSLSGNGVSVAVGDNADPTSHIDNQKNMVNRNPLLITAGNHGTLVTGIISGDGIIRERLTGVAVNSFVVTDIYDYVVSKAPIYASDYGVTVTNNSYFNGLNGCIGNSIYNELSAYIDAQLYNNPFLEHIFASGNDGALTCSPYPLSFGTIKSGYQTAKNVLTVGNYDVSLTVPQIYSSSSRGPVEDGRIKPEIVASGASVWGTISNNGYNQSWGTSFSTPVVTGIWAMLTERYKQLHSGVNPKSGLLKAIVCNTAVDKGNAGPDYKHGFGLIQAQRAVAALEQNRYYTNSVTMGANHSRVIAVPAGTSQLKVMLYWHDKEGSPINFNALENDLDLTVVNAGTTHRPLVLNPAPVSVDNPAAEGIDRINNIEQVVITNPGTSVTINVDGFNVTGSQEFFVSYEFIQPEIILLHPYGGERFATASSTGQGELIAWEANDNSTDTYKLEYSLDDGINWLNIADGISANTFRYGWSVPNVSSNKAKVRIKRSSGSVYTTMQGNFVISNLPVVTLSVPCEGYVDLSWAAVPGATDYEVMQLMNGSLATIATTTSVTHRVSGLDRNSSYWFTIRPRLNDSIARRADAKMIIPASGTPCADAAFDNDLKIDTLLTPQFGRKNTSTELSATQPVIVRIKNLDNNASSTTYTISYQLGAGPVINENPGISIAAGATLNYTFTVPANVSATGEYALKVVVKQTGDTRIENDERTFSIRHLDNAPVSLPVTEDFEATGANDEYRSLALGISNANRFDYENTGRNGRLRTFINSSMQVNGNRSAILDAAQFLGTSTTNRLYGTFNLSGEASNTGLRLDFKYKNHGQRNLPAAAVWVRGKDDLPWIQVQQLNGNQTELGEVNQAWFNVYEIVTNAGQPLTSSFQVRFDQSGFTSSNNGTYVGDVADNDDGLSFDDIRLSSANNDLTVTQILAPSALLCNAGTNANVSIRVKNVTGNSYTNVPVYFRVDNGSSVAGTIPVLAANSTVDYTFVATADLSAFKAYEIDAWVQLPGDNYAVNDSITDYQVNNSPVISSYPFLERFENNDGSFFTKGNYSYWKWGATDVVTRTKLNRAANGNNGWYTGLFGGYKPNDSSFLYTPCFDLSSLTNPVLSFAHISQQEDNIDYHTIEYTTDNGVTWQRLGVQNGGINWFNGSSNIWRTSLQRWHVSSVSIPTNASAVRFRFLFYSNGSTQREGIGIDDFRIHEGESVFSGYDVTTAPQTINGGNNWIHFSEGGELIASVNPLGQNLGSTTAAVYFNTTGLTRFINGYYYMDRNIVLRSANAPTDSVLVRFYFTETDAANMIGASSCGPGCQTISDAFVTGVYKFSGSEPVENGVIDDGTGTYQFITPEKVDVVPFNNGYYAEFKVRSFSEFWLTGADLNITVTPVNDIERSGTFIKTVYQSSGQTLFIQKGDRFQVREMNIKVMSSTGQQLLSKTTAYTDASLDISKLSAGVYIIEITDATGKERFVKKFVKTSH
ncbi:MAG TPA: S8 family serine peptidase [Lacibacter sp.]|nr:S8 family serine peptidase [Lacibacter sp.]